MDGKKMRAAVVTEGAAQAVLRRGVARELDATEEKVMRMRLGAGLPSAEPLERVGRGITDAEIELLAYEIEGWMEMRARRAAHVAAAASKTAPAPAPVPSRAKERIIRALRAKSK